MQIGTGQVSALMREEEGDFVRIACPANLVPAPGQYLLASAAPNSPLPTPLLFSDSIPQGFIAVAPTASGWRPGMALQLRGPLGRGFSLPADARNVGLVAFDASPALLKGMVTRALAQKAAVVLLSRITPANLPDEVEVQPLSALPEVLHWADYLAFDAGRENLPSLREALSANPPRGAAKGVQVLVRTPVPCGGLAECGVCAVMMKTDWRLGCKDGPVFEWRELR